jgi:excisionase family DNA binding protein
MDSVEFWKVKEVAALLRVNTKTVYTWVARGTVDSVRIPSGGIRIPDREVQRLYRVEGVTQSDQAP